MSLEIEIQKNTEAVLALTNAVLLGNEQGLKALALTEKLTAHIAHIQRDEAPKAQKTKKVETPAPEPVNTSAPEPVNTSAPEPVSTTDAAPAAEPVSTTDAAPAAEPVSTTEAAPAPAAEASPMPTLAHLQAEGKKLMDAGQQALLKQIVLANGGTKLSLLPESGYRATLKALKAAVAAL
jgi:hypothetical protein